MKNSRTAIQEFRHWIMPMLPNASVGLGLPKTGDTPSSAAGDDGDLKIGLPTSGPRFSALNAYITFDNVTGLMWPKASLLLPAPFVVDGVDQLLSWYDAIDACEACEFAGFSDWRMPTVVDILTILYSNFTGKIIAQEYFGPLHVTHYWTSTTWYFNTEEAITWFLNGGFTQSEVKTHPHCYVLPVRGGLEIL